MRNQIEYRIVRVCGTVEKCRIPSFISPATVAIRCPHSMVFMKVGKRQNAWVDGPADGFIGGDAWVLVLADGKVYGPAGEPKTEAEAYAIWLALGEPRTAGERLSLAEARA